MKKFHRLHKVVQWGIAVVCSILLLIILSAWAKAVIISKIWIALIFVMVPIIQFLITPLFTLLNLYTYYSPMVISFGNNPRMLDLHNGTSFDYLFEMTDVKAGIQWRNKMLSYYLEALLKIIGKVENGELETTAVIRGSSYFLSERSAKKLGFSMGKTSMAEQMNIAVNYLDLIWMYSLTNGKLTFPNLRNIATVRITGAKLIQQKGRILALANRLKR